MHDVIYGELCHGMIRQESRTGFESLIHEATTTKLGFPESTIVPIGIVLFLCTLLYVLPRTTILGAILLTGYLSEAVARPTGVAMAMFLDHEGWGEVDHQ